MKQMYPSWFSLTMLAAESQQVIMLRTLKLARGGGKAEAEARRMVSEKLISAGIEGARLASGATSQSVVARYRKKVRANLPQLNKTS
jgi:hypothetical protein